MSGAEAVLTLVMLEWTVGWVGAAAWTQWWGVVRRGHFRILGWGAIALAALALVSLRSAAGSSGAFTWTAVLLAAAVLYLVAQYVRTDVPGAVVGTIATVVGVGALWYTGGLLDEWSNAAVLPQLLAGAALLGGVTNGMLLGHWYLNQPGLKPWALARLTVLTLVAVAASAIAGLAAAPRLSGASTSGAVLGIPGFGDSFGLAFFLIWLAIIAFTGIVAWMARRCVAIRSIQSATGLYYVALLTAGVSEFLVRYLMVNAT
ncbi:MAG TPA: hypothetical protein VFA00_05250 [Actinomycetota bacterium]|nr:hypothetical protein [Actinomycetota bacterium]